MSRQDSAEENIGEMTRQARDTITRLADRGASLSEEEYREVLDQIEAARAKVRAADARLAEKWLRREQEPTP